MTNTKLIAKQALIACIYTLLSLVTAPISFSIFQIRLSESLCVLPIFGFSNIWGITIGCALTNFLMFGNIIDVIFGTFATFIGAIGTHYFRKNYILAVACPILSNAIILPIVFKYAYGLDKAIWFFFIQTFVSQIIAIGLIGKIVVKLAKSFNIML